jgi:hypothetical protein
MAASLIATLFTAALFTDSLFTASLVAFSTESNATLTQLKQLICLRITETPTKT